MTPTIDVSKYDYNVHWSDEDGEYVATCLEFPSLSWLDESLSGALSGIVAVVNEVVKDLHQSGEPVPEPVSTRKFSGKFQLRTSPLLHAQLVREALEQGLSLNALANQKLSMH
jgi:predicted RNase H-like HicB family nuclease